MHSSTDYNSQDVETTQVPINKHLGTSLVVQWLRICLPIWGHGFNLWYRKIPQVVVQLSPGTTSREVPAHYNSEKLTTAMRSSLQQWRPVCACPGAQACLTFCSPVDCNPWGSSVHGSFQARILEWVAISSSGGIPLPDPGIAPQSPASLAWAGRFFTIEPPGKLTKA